jgi:replicative DNA helicase
MATSRIEEVILSNLVNSEEYCRKVLPFISPDYFSDHSEKEIFTEIKSFFNQYSKVPNQQILKIAFEDRQDLKQSEYDDAMELISSLVESEPNQIWLIERTEKFVKDSALYNAVAEAVSVLDGKNTKLSKDGIPSLLQEALSISFDKTIGHDFFDDADKRYEFYHLKEDRVPFGLDMFNKITGGGLPKKTLSCVLAGVNVGKSLVLCDFAASVLLQGKNVLYITLEMAEERIAERIDCNMMDIPIDKLPHISKEDFSSKIDSIRRKTEGKLIVKEYPTSGAHVGHFKALLDELVIKRGFVPDFICVDYINLCLSQRLVGGHGANSYTIIKSIAEELRGMAVEYDVPILTATQTTRQGWQNSDIEMSDTAESAGLPATLDFMFALIRTDELDELGQLMVKQLKSRLGNPNFYKRFVIGVDIAKFKLYDVVQPTRDLSDVGKTDKADKPVFDKSKFGSRNKSERSIAEIDFS